MTGEWQDIDFALGTLQVRRVLSRVPTKMVKQMGESYVEAEKKLLQKAGLPDIRFHDLRHSVATMLLSMGTHPKVVQELLGHSQISMTLDIYSHVLPTMQRDAIGKLNDALSKQDDGAKQSQE